MPLRYFYQLDESDFFSWISSVRAANSTGEQKRRSEYSIFSSLQPFAEAIAFHFSDASNHDPEQIVVDSFDKLFHHYIRDPEFRFHSCGHAVRLLRQIVINERRQTYRRKSRSKRAPFSLNGNKLSIKSITVFDCDCISSADDPARVCENREEIENLLTRLSESHHRELFHLLLEDYTRDEIATKMQVDARTIRLWIDQIRRILTPHTSFAIHQAPSTKHQAPSTKHQAPSTKHQVRSMYPIIFRGINDQGYHPNSLLQRG